MKDSALIGEKSAKAYGRSLPVSLKKSIEICNFIRGKSIKKSRDMLQRVIEHKAAVPYRRFARGGTGHKKGIGPGRFPERTCKELLKLIKQAEANAQQKGLDTEKLVISAISANKGGTSWHYGRKRRRQMKIAHIKMIVREKNEESKESKK